MEGRVCAVKWLPISEADALNFETVLQGAASFSAADVDALAWSALELNAAVPVAMEWDNMVYKWTESISVRHNLALRGWTEKKVLLLVELKSGIRFLLGMLHAPVLLTEVKNIGTSGTDSMTLGVQCRQPVDAVAVV